LSSLKNHISFILWLIGILWLSAAVSSCRVAKDLDEGERLLVQNKVELQGKSELNSEELSAIIKQKPNTKLFFFFRFNAWLYNKYDQEKLALKREKKQRRIDRKNERRTNAGKDPKKISSDTWRDRLVNNVGEKPAVYDSSKVEISKNQLEVYLKKNGYFSPSVSHSLKHKGVKKVKSIYNISAGRPHLIDSIKWTIVDSAMSKYLSEFKSLSKFKKGSRFSVEQFDESRELVTKYLRNNGYFKFSKDYITFKVDTLNRSYNAGLEVVMTSPSTESNLNPDSLIFKPHKRFKLGRIDFHLGYDPLAQSYEPTDRLISDNQTFEYVHGLDFNTSLLVENILLKSGKLYALKDVENTYKKLRNLGVFNYVDIGFSETTNSSNEDILKCDIYLNTGKYQSTSFEITGTHRDGIWGANLKNSYTHKNLFRGAENLEVRFQVGAEAVQPVDQIQTEDDFTQTINDNLNLNSFILGPEVKLNLHKLVGFKKLSSKKSTPLTVFTANYNFQIRPDFERSLAELNFGYKFREKANHSFFISPVDLSVIGIEKSQAFQDRLDEINDLFLINSYIDHFIPSANASWQFSNQKQQFQSNYTFNALSIETAGLLTRAGFRLGDNEQDDNGSYRIAGIRFAQYIKLENDFRIYKNFSRNQSLANRIDLGIGVPYANSRVLPFEKSFFAGGSNGVRAWQARTLGPGSYRDTTALISFNNLGELKLMVSSEYRFDLTNTLEGALFMDAGNIWILEDEDQKEGSEFSSQFYNQLALGAGFGIRLDFDFFLIRFDLGFKLRDPSLVSGERWAWQPKDDFNDYLENLRSRDLTTETRYNYAPNINLGIGYPF